ncbi:hypothetical protein NL676_004015 [Syzygium grande]|nr:hypothetical protein NL676_004015 [Syzygium grande]
MITTQSVRAPPMEELVHTGDLARVPTNYDDDGDDARSLCNLSLHCEAADDPSPTMSPPHHPPRPRITTTSSSSHRLGTLMLPPTSTPTIGALSLREAHPSPRIASKSSSNSS